MINIKKLLNYDPFEWKIKSSAGVIIILKGDKFLLCHPTGHKWVDSYSFPKGGIEKDETKIEAAIRELREETSLIINESMIENINNPIIIDYKNKRGFNYKKVYLFIVRINEISEVGLENETLDRSLLQLEEVDWCGFLSKSEANIRIFKRFSPLLNLLN